MQFKIFTVPALGGGAENDALNDFLRSRRILHVEQQLAHEGGCAFWSFSVKYLADAAGGGQPVSLKKDWAKELDPASFSRFQKLRAVRKAVASEEAQPAFVVFTDEQLAALARIEPLTAAAMLAVPGVGEKKVERYAHRFLESPDRP